MKKILFPTDFSDAANRAFIYALNLTAHVGGQITTVHVYQNPEIPSTMLSNTLNDFMEQFEIDTFKNYQDNIPPLNKIAEEYGFADLDIRHVLEKGPVVKTILEVAARDEVDMIIMGTTGASGFKELVIGSIAGEVLEKAPCPVLAVPTQAVFDGKIDNIAFTTTFSEEEKLGFEKVLGIAEPLKAKVHCVNVDLAHTEFYLQRMKKMEENYPNRPNLAFKSLDGTNIKEELTRYMEENSIDILAMITHKRNFFQELFHFSKTKMMSYHTKTPILALPSSMVAV